MSEVGWFGLVVFGGLWAGGPANAPQRKDKQQHHSSIPIQQRKKKSSAVCLRRQQSLFLEEKRDAAEGREDKQAEHQAAPLRGKPTFHSMEQREWSCAMDEMAGVLFLLLFVNGGKTASQLINQ